MSSWIDLANAYGSVPHNLIQFALSWYHIPLFLQELIFNYYELLKATVTTKAWTTAFFCFAIGVFQGCPLSAILFDVVFNLLVDFLSTLKHLGYILKATRISSFTTAFADDLNITTRSPKGNQTVLDLTDTWLSWTRTMRAKPRKCVSIAFRQC